jgi:hypothetical protein
LVPGIDKLTVCRLHTNPAFVRALAFIFGKTVSTEKAVAVQDEFTDLFETGLALVAMLRILVHI